MANVRALEDQAAAYIELSNAEQKNADNYIISAGFKTSANDKQAESIRQIMSLEELQYRMREKNLSQYTSALSKQQQDWGKIASKIESELQKELAKTDKEIGKEFEKQIADQENVYRARINNAMMQGGDLGASQEMLAIYQEQIENIGRMEAVYKAAGMTDLDIQNMRIEARQKVQQAETDIANIQFQNTQRQLNIAGQTAGALSSMFEALGGESEKYAAFAKSMAVMQVILTQAIAIAKAVQGGAEYPFPFNIIAVAGSVAAITAAIASSVNTVKSTEVPKYAAGGLVSGPGTGTSDSIPARLSNGEAVMTAAAVNEWGSMLSAMNVSSGGNAINVSNLPQRGDGMRGMERMMERVMMNMPSPVVSVVDINKGQRKVQVQDNISKLGRKKYA